MNALSVVPAKSSNFVKYASVSLAVVLPTALAQAAITPPTLDNAAYVLMDYDTGTILAQKMPSSRYRLPH